MKFLRYAPAALLLLSFIACNQTASDKSTRAERLEAATENYKQEENGTANNFIAADSSAPPAPGKPPSTQTEKTGPHENWDKKIIKTATITLEVNDYKAFNDLLHIGVRESGGYMAGEEQTQSDYKIENAVIIKVPVDQFDNAVARLTPSNGTLVEKKISSQDVTTEVVDTRSRMETKKRVRDRYVDLLKQAKNMEEILQVQRQIDEIQGEAEGAAGRLEYLSHASSWSTINLTYYQVLNPSAGAPAAVPSYGSRLAESFRSGLTWFGEASIFIISLWPLWLGLFAGWLVIRKYKPSATKKQ